MTDTNESESFEYDESDLHDSLGWIVDVPLFIDEKRVAQLYDITIRPVFYEYQKNPIEELSRVLTSETDEAAGGVEGSIQSSSLFGALASGKLGARLEGRHSSTDEEEDQVRYQLTQTPQRQLAQITLQYYSQDKEQDKSGSPRNFYYSECPILGAEDESSDDLEEWMKSSSVSDPRDLVVLELPGITEVEKKSSAYPTRFIPTAAEFENGTVVELYKEFERLDQKPPCYPLRGKRWDQMGEYYNNIEESHELSEFERNGTISDDELEAARKYYWKWFDDVFSPTEAVRIVESAGEEHGSIRWIDFQLPLDQSGNTLHLHVQGREKFNTGSFTYNLIKRGNEYGILLVGTIKSGPDMDVLAIYER